MGTFVGYEKWFIVDSLRIPKKNAVTELQMFLHDLDVRFLLICHLYISEFLCGRNGSQSMYVYQDMTLYFEYCDLTMWECKHITDNYGRQLHRHTL